MRQQTAPEIRVDGFTFPPFSLARLMRTVFDLKPGESFGVFTDLEDEKEVVDLRFLGARGPSPRKHAYRTLYRGLRDLREELAIADVAFYAYRETGGSNLDLPGTVTAPDATELPLRSALARHSIVLFMGRYSATAPVTALAKEMGFRGATMHGANDRILSTGLAVDYDEVSARAERLRRALTRADSARMEWHVAGRDVALELDLDRQEAQKSHGLVRDAGEIANLPAGEVYWVPADAEGFLPQKFDDGTIAVFEVRDRGITALSQFFRGDRALVEDHLATILRDPNAGQITELGLGTQSLPFADADIQDEKILGTAHVATGRSDHLGGDIDSGSFLDRRNATHNDILFAPNKTPEIELRRVILRKDGRETTILRDYRPTAFLDAFL
ncbi:MAG: hypothetical protein ACREID_03720 [Planctomycetota bacterium]